MKLSKIFLLSLVSFAFLLNNQTTAFAYEEVEILKRVVNVRSGAGIDNQRLGKAFKGEKYPVLRKLNNWINIRFRDASSGWVRSDLVKIIEREKMRIKILNASRLKNHAAGVKKYLEGLGYNIDLILDNPKPKNVWKGAVFYKDGFKEEARTLAEELYVDPGRITPLTWTSAFDVIILLGATSPTGDGLMLAKEIAEEERKVAIEQVLEAPQEEEIKGTIGQVLEAPSKKAAYFISLAEKNEEDGDKNAAIENYLKALKIDPERKELHYLIGKLYHDMRNYSKSLEHLQEVEDMEGLDPLYDYYLGYVYLRVHDYDLAPFYLLKSANENYNYRVKSYFYSARSFYKRRDYPLAKSWFEEVARLMPDSKMGQKSAEYMDAIKQIKEAKRWWKLAASAGFQYDDNVKLEPEEEASGQEATRTILTVNVNAAPLKLKKGNISMDYILYWSVHITNRDKGVDKFDVQSHIGSLNGNYIPQDGILGLPMLINMNYTYNFTRLGGKKYSQSHTIAPSVKVFESQSHFTDVKYGFRKDLFIINPDRNGSNHQIGFNHFYLLKGGEASLNGGIILDRNVTDAKDFKYSGYKGLIGIMYPFLYGISLRLSTNYYYKDFSEHTDGRTDKILTVTPGVQKSLHKNISINMNYTYTRNDAQAKFKYDRSLIALSIMGNY